MSDKLGVALVGCGGIARCHAFALTRVPQVRLVADWWTSMRPPRIRLQGPVRVRGAQRQAWTKCLTGPDVGAVVITTSNKYTRPPVGPGDAGRQARDGPKAHGDEPGRGHGQMVAVGRREQRQAHGLVLRALLAARRSDAKAIIDAGLDRRSVLVQGDLWRGTGRTMPSAGASTRRCPAAGVIMDGNVHHISNALVPPGRARGHAAYTPSTPPSRRTRRSRTPPSSLMRTPTALCEISGLQPVVGAGRDTANFKDSWQIYGTKGHRSSGTRAGGPRCGSSAVTMDVSPILLSVAAWTAPAAAPYPRGPAGLFDAP